MLYRKIFSSKVLTMQPNIYMGQIFSDDAAKKARQVWRWKKMAHPWSETTETFVDHVF